MIYIKKIFKTGFFFLSSSQCSVNIKIWGKGIFFYKILFVTPRGGEPKDQLPKEISNFGTRNAKEVRGLTENFRLFFGQNLIESKINFGPVHYLN